MNKRRLIAFLGAAVGVIAIAGPASASIQVESVQYGSASSPLPMNSPETLSLPQFNTSLGTLTGVSIELSAYDTISSVVYNATGQSAAYSGATAVMTVKVTASLGSSDSDVLTTSGTGIAGPFTSLSPIPPGPSVAGWASIPTQTDTINPGNLGIFEGTGMLPITISADSVGSYSGTGGSSLFFGGIGYSYGTVEVDYSYDSQMVIPIPEPNTLCAGLAVASICGIGFARRFRRTSSRA
jgi:hypothetical protein